MYEINFKKKTSQGVGGKNKLDRNFGGKNPWINAEISTVNKIEMEPFPMYQATVKREAKCKPQFKLFNRINSLEVFSPQVNRCHFSCIN